MINANDEKTTGGAAVGAEPRRREFLSRASSLAMTAGLLGGYGTLAAIAARFLYPARPAEKQWLFVAEAERLATGDSLLYRGPAGETINIARQGRGRGAADFVALSSTCPHLGCQVHWEPQNNRFFCPCHNGVFDPSGVATSGPPAEAGQSLARYPLKIEGGLLYIEVPLPLFEMAAGWPGVVERPERARGPGHDPCLARAVARGGPEARAQTAKPEVPGAGAPRSLRRAGAVAGDEGSRA